MEESDQQRRAAAENFLKSLEELEDILKQNSPKEEEPVNTQTQTTIDLSAWEDAVADIEQYLQNKNKNS